MSFLHLLCLLFIGLKLGGVIDWSWLVVLSPLILHVLVVTAIKAWEEHKNKTDPLWRFRK